MYELLTRFCLGEMGNSRDPFKCFILSERFSWSVTLFIVPLDAENSCWCALFCHLKIDKAACFKGKNHSPWTFSNLKKDLIFLNPRKLFAWYNIFSNIKAKGLWLILKRVIICLLFKLDSFKSIKFYYLENYLYFSLTMWALIHTDTVFWGRQPKHRNI